MGDELITKELTGSPWRKYHWITESGVERSVKICNPQQLILRPGGTTHRVVDASGEVFIVPAVGHFGCYITYEPADPKTPARF